MDLTIVNQYVEQLKTWWSEGKFSNQFTYTIEDGYIHFYIISLQNTYSITVVPATNEKQSYMGCVTSSRLPDVDETWLRGNDLADGVFSKDTWHKILIDIVANEMQVFQRKNW